LLKGGFTVSGLLCLNRTEDATIIASQAVLRVYGSTLSLENLREEMTLAVRRPWMFLLFWFLTIVYFILFGTRHYTPDGINNLFFIENNNVFELWHTQHLLAQWPGYWLYCVLHSLLGGSVRAWVAMRIANAFLAGLTVALTYATLLHLTKVSRIAIAGAFVLWFSYGFWHYHGDPEIYGLGYVATALLMLCYIRFIYMSTTRNVLWLGLAAAFAVLSHQLNLLFAGLIGITMIILLRNGSAQPDRQRILHLALYAVTASLSILVVYSLGWLTVNAYYAESKLPEVAFRDWALRYLTMAQSGQATWGISANIESLPIAGYAFLSSWVLLPKLDQVDVWMLLLLGMLILGAIIVAIHILIILRRLGGPQRYIALPCIATLILNGLGSWWWQAGNIKFYLFMQIQLIILVALYAQAVMKTQRRERRMGFAALMGVGLGLALFHLLFTLPYELRGGVFTVAERANNKPVFVWFENQDQRRLFTYITQHSADNLAGDLCHHTSENRGQATWWVISEQTMTSCPAFAQMEHFESFHADRSRQRWWIVGREDITSTESAEPTALFVLKSCPMVNHPIALYTDDDSMLPDPQQGHVARLLRLRPSMTPYPVFSSPARPFFSTVGCLVLLQRSVRTDYCQDRSAALSW
jgi:hypothetical protein